MPPSRRATAASARQGTNPARAAAGYAGLLGRLSGFGDIALVGVEGTGSYGAGLARHLAAADVRVVEVDRPERQDRHRRGTSDPLDVVSATRAAQSGRASGLIVLQVRKLQLP